MLDGDTSNANHSPALALLAGFVYSFFWFVGFVGSMMLALPWAFIVAIVFGLVAGSEKLFETTIREDTRTGQLVLGNKCTGKFFAIGRITGGLILITIVGVLIYKQITLPQGLIPGYQAEESLVIRLIPTVLFFTLLILSRKFFERQRQQPAHDQGEQEQP
jgi:hypothetical protein